MQEKSQTTLQKRTLKLHHSQILDHMLRLK